MANRTLTDAELCILDAAVFWAGVRRGIFHALKNGQTGNWEVLGHAEQRLMRLADAYYAGEDLADLREVAVAAKEYRDRERDETPRLWKGKELCDLSDKLDLKLEKVFYGH